MNLADFISASLVDIARGVIKANATLMKEYEPDSGKNPFLLEDGLNVMEERGFVEFDVALTATKGGGKSGGGGLQVVGVSVGGKASEHHGEQSVSRIKFLIRQNKRIG